MPNSQAKVYRKFAVKANVYRQNWIDPHTGEIHSEVVYVSPQFLKMSAWSTMQMMARGIDVPVCLDHQESARPHKRKLDDYLADEMRSSVGLLRSVEYDPDSEEHIYTYEVNDPEIAKKIDDGTIKRVSPDFMSSCSPGDGAVYRNVIGHLALTFRPKDYRQSGEPMEVAQRTNDRGMRFSVMPVRNTPYRIVPMNVLSFSTLKTLARMSDDKAHVDFKTLDYTFKFDSYEQFTSWLHRRYHSTLQMSATGRIGHMLYFSVIHAPIGGVTIMGKRYLGGQFIPNQAMDQLDEQQKKELEASALASDKKRAEFHAKWKRPHENWNEALARHVGQHAGQAMSDDDRAAAKKYLSSLRAYHGENTIAKVAALAGAESKALADGNGDKELASRRLRMFHEMGRMLNPDSDVSDIKDDVKLNKSGASKLIDNVMKNGGFTYRAISKLQPTKGFVVSTTKNLEQVVSSGEITPKHLQDYVDKNRDVLAQPNAHLGAWVDGGKVYLDVSRVFTDKNEALKLAEEHQQEGIYDLGNGKTIYTKWGNPPEGQEREAYQAAVPSGDDAGRDGKSDQSGSEGTGWREPAKVDKAANAALSDHGSREMTDQLRYQKDVSGDPGPWQSRVISHGKGGELRYTIHKDGDKNRYVLAAIDVPEAERRKGVAEDMLNHFFEKAQGSDVDVSARTNLGKHLEPLIKRLGEKNKSNLNWNPSHSRFAVVHAHVGGENVQGHQYAGGQFVPGQHGSPAAQVQSVASSVQPHEIHRVVKAITGGSRTAKAGQYSQETSPDKPGHMAGTDLQSRAQSNIHEAAHYILHNKHAPMRGADDAQNLLHHLGKTVNNGIIHDDHLIRRHADERGYGYSAPEEIPKHLENFYHEFSHRVNHADPIETAAWTEHTLNKIHPFSDGMGRTSKLMANWVLARHGLETPSYPQKHYHRNIGDLKNFTTDYKAWMGRLSPEDAQKAAMDFVQHEPNYAKMKDAYLKQHGTYDENGNLKSVPIDLDNWREHIPGYVGHNSAHVHEAAGVANDRFLNEMLTQMKGKGNGKVVMLGGAGGSGKGTFVGRHLDQSQYPVRIDQVSKGYDKLVSDAERYKAMGYQPDIVFVDRAPNAAWHGVVGRAMENHGTGDHPRTVPASVAVPANIEARQTALRLAKERPDLPLRVINNNVAGPNDISYLENRDDIIRHLSGQQYNSADEIAKAKEHVNGLEKAGKLAPHIAAALRS